MAGAEAYERLDAPPQICFRNFPKDCFDLRAFWKGGLSAGGFERRCVRYAHQEMNLSKAQKLLAPVRRISGYLDDPLCAPEFGEEPVMRRVLVAEIEAQPGTFGIDFFSLKLRNIDIVLREERGNLRPRPAAVVDVNDVTSDEVALSKEPRFDSVEDVQCGNGENRPNQSKPRKTRADQQADAGDNPDGGGRSKAADGPARLYDCARAEKADARDDLRGDARVIDQPAPRLPDDEFGDEHIQRRPEADQRVCAKPCGLSGPLTFDADDSATKNGEPAPEQKHRKNAEEEFSCFHTLLFND